MIKAGIIGSTGYAGAELVRILLAHKEVELVWYGSRSYVDQNGQRKDVTEIQAESMELLSPRKLKNEE